MSTTAVDDDPEGSVRAIVEEARKAVEIDKAEVICLGCAGMAGLEEAITAEVGVPVIDGVGAAVRLAEAVVGLGLKTSKISTYASPDPKKIIAWPLSEALGDLLHSGAPLTGDLIPQDVNSPPRGPRLTVTPPIDRQERRRRAARARRATYGGH